MKYAAIDPGYTTGLAFRIEGQLRTLAWDTKSDVDGVLQLLVPGLDRVIIERFATGGTLSAPGLFTIDLGAQIKGWCKALKIPWEYRAPNERYMFMPLAQGAVGHVIEPGPWAKHEVDALAHLLYFEHNHSIDSNITWKPKDTRTSRRPVRRTGLDMTKRMERLRERFDDDALQPL